MQRIMQSELFFSCHCWQKVGSGLAPLFACPRQSQLVEKDWLGQAHLGPPNRTAVSYVRLTP